MHMTSLRPESGDPNEIARAAFEHIRDEFNDAATISDSYLYAPSGEDFADEIGFVDGAENPEEIIRIAANWNEGIRRTFDLAINGMLKAVKTREDGEKDWLSVRSTAIYSMKKAAILLDDSFYDFSDCIVQTSEYAPLRTQLNEAELKDIMTNPQDYVAFSVGPK